MVSPHGRFFCTRIWVCRYFLSLQSLSDAASHVTRCHCITPLFHSTPTTTNPPTPHHTKPTPRPNYQPASTHTHLEFAAHVGAQRDHIRAQCGRIRANRQQSGRELLTRRGDGDGGDLRIGGGCSKKKRLRQWMDEDKKRGRNCVRFFSRGNQQKISRMLDQNTALFRKEQKDESL
jgi:hypothetical protein